MTALVLIAGKLCGEPVTRPTKNDGRVTFFKVKTSEGSSLVWWSVASFSDSVRDEIAELREGDAISVTGALSIEEWESNGRRGINRKILADRVLSLRSAPKSKAEKPPTRPAEPARRGTGPIDPEAVARYAAGHMPDRPKGGEFDDDIEF